VIGSWRRVLVLAPHTDDGDKHGGTQGSPVGPLLNSPLDLVSWWALAGQSPASPSNPHLQSDRREIQ
jgi:hypothetical protein